VGVNENHLRPLRDRVQARSTLELPSGPPGYRWRTLRDDDAPRLTAVAESMSTRDHPNWSESLEEIDDQLSRSWFSPATDGVLCESPVGAPVAYGTVTMPPDPESLVRVFLGGGVAPAHRARGLGRELIVWQHERARQLLASSSSRLPAWVMTHAADLAPEHGALLRRHGFEAARYFTTLECAVAGNLSEPAPRAPQGVTIVPFTSELSGNVRQAKNSVFADHWGSQPAGIEQWESMVKLSSFRPELSRLALDGDEVVGFVTTEINEEDWARQGYSSGYIALVGTVRSWRRRGLASALLREVLAAYRERGLDRAVLDVDTESPTGALGVYTALGFAPTLRDVAYRVAY